MSEPTNNDTPPPASGIPSVGGDPPPAAPAVVQETVARRVGTRDSHSKAAVGKILAFWLVLSCRFVYAIIQGKVTRNEAILGASFALLVVGVCVWWIRRTPRRPG